MAESTVTPVQAFRYGNNVFALQFHSELTESNTPIFIRELTPQIVPGRFVQQPTEMLQYISSCRINNQVFAKMLDEILYLGQMK
jgi:GMP synthase-like glutamine amidotransferase